MATEIGWGYSSIAKEVEQPKAEEPTVDEPTVDEEVKEEPTEGKEEAKPQDKKKK